ncbi:hypothetical protein FHS43_002268 [Streptosporangium becharense]|uniref:Uncharacterized protein n=1 Tax=Streptosporangium becharense TaxID=1816182 RepID=A0A7W9MIY0_9ACTN|nr:hypothetical protein [Streptosporangium becharense]MBB5821939.1 hypothetical protein [Streptosporangium becharense]
MATATFRDENATARCSVETALLARPDASPARELVRLVPRTGG